MGIQPDHVAHTERSEISDGNTAVAENGPDGNINPLDHVLQISCVIFITDILDRGEPELGIQLIHDIFQRQVGKTDVHQSLYIPDLHVQGDDGDHLAGSDDLGELGVRLDTFQRRCNIHNVFPGFPKEVHTDDSDTLKERKLDLREISGFFKGEAFTSQHSVDHGIAQVRSDLHDDVSGQRLEIDDRQNDRIGKCVGKLRECYGLGTVYGNLHVLTQING